MQRNHYVPKKRTQIGVKIWATPIRTKKYPYQDLKFAQELT